MGLSAARLAMAFAAGLLAGGVYFWGLWWTINRMTGFVHPRLALLVSFMGRSLIALAVFYLASGGSAAGYLACAAGFLVVRVVAVRGARRDKAEEAG